jgi:hypothetical protein
MQNENSITLGIDTRMVTAIAAKTVPNKQTNQPLFFRKS